MNLLAANLIYSHIKIRNLYGIYGTVFREHGFDVTIKSRVMLNAEIVIKCVVPDSQNVVADNNIAYNLYCYGWKSSLTGISEEQKKEMDLLLKIFKTHLCDMSLDASFEKVTQCWNNQ